MEAGALAYSDCCVLVCPEATAGLPWRSHSKSSPPAESLLPLAILGELNTGRKEQEAAKAKDPLCAFSLPTDISRQVVLPYCARKETQVQRG